MSIRIEQLMNIFNGAVWDGNLISKVDRDELVKASLVQKVRGIWNIITPKGVEYLLDLGLVRIIPRYRQRKY